LILFVVADEVSVSNVVVQPEDGMSGNPYPVVDTLEPGWNN
jgi:hypothetical protein